MTRLAIGRELGCGVRRIVSLIIIILMTANTGVGYIGIVPVVALVAGCRDMCAGQLPVSIMDCKCGRFPARVGGMAIGTGCRNVGCLVRRVYACIIIGLVTVDAGIRGGVIIAVMTLITAGRGVCAGQGIVCIVNCERGRFPTGVCSMTVGTGCRYLCSLVVRICGGIIISLVTADTLI
jgi:hypothetical protein